MAGNRSYTLNRRNREEGLDLNRELEGSLFDKEASQNLTEVANLSLEQKRALRPDDYEKKIWSSVVDMRLCEDFIAIKYQNGNKVFMPRAKLEGTALQKLYRDLLGKYQPDTKIAAKDFSISWNQGRWRGQLYHCSNGWMAALRQMPYRKPDLGKLGLDRQQVTSLASDSGLVIFAGPTGAGKSTSMAALIYELQNRGELGDTITIEDPVEFLYDDPFIQQREVGVDVGSFSDGIYEAMRQSPETIVIGEIRNYKAAEAAIQAGLTGHRVLATLHAESIEEAVARLYSLLDNHYEDLLAQALQGMMAQHLIRNEQGRIITLYETLRFDRPAKTLLTGKAESLPRLIHEQNRQLRHTLKDIAKEKFNAGLLRREDIARWVI